MKGHIFDNLGLSHSHAAELKVRAVVLDAILRKIKRDHLSQVQLVQMLDEYQPNVSALVNGKISKISLDKLVRYADRLGIEFNVTAVSRTSARRTATAKTAVAKKAHQHERELAYA
jgi:predicted XRE-type DNA-binding protein